MSNSRLRGRAAFTCVAALVCASAVACDSVLDIEEPMLRPGDGGEPNAGGTAEPTAGSAPTVGGAGPGEAGAGGVAGAMTPSAGAGSGGEGGEPHVVSPKDCVPEAMRCDGLTPKVCDGLGSWRQNEAEAPGECAVACHEGRCVECLPEQTRCTACADGDAGCNPNQPQTCEDGTWKSKDPACKHFCDGGECVTPPSCDPVHAARTTCASNTSCCAARVVPGGTFTRSFDATEDFPDEVAHARVSAFILDKFEVTVGRMRQFVNAFEAFSPVPGQGKAPHISQDLGWVASLSLPATKDDLIDLLTDEEKCAQFTWSDDTLENNDLPINCVPFAVAYAFCIWDGGRLPTDAEWNFAAAGGAEQRPFPWQTPTPAPADWDGYASYGTDTPVPVGSKPLGDSRWGQSDLSGSLTEWTLDFHESELPATCDDCVNATANAERTKRGSSYTMPADFLRVSFRYSGEMTEQLPEGGFRCARDVARAPE